MIKKKICFIAQFPPPMHGLSKAVETLYNSNLCKEFEFEKVDITSNKNIIKNLVTIGHSNADLFYFTISQTKGGNLRDLVILRKIASKHKQCIVHLHGGYYRKLVDYDLPEWQRKANYNVIGKLDGVIVLSKSLKSIFQGMISDDKIFVVPNCVDDEFLLTNTAFQKKIAMQKNKKIRHVLYLSNFIKTKGYPIVLEMAKFEKERVAAGEKKSLHFDFAGKFFKEKEQKYFEYYIADNHLEDFVTYHGIVDGYKKRKLLEQCDVFTLLTRYPNEGQPISILEAMGNGMAIVTTNHAGIPDIVHNGKNGIVCNETIDVKELLKKIDMLDLGLIGRNNWEAVINHYMKKQYIMNMKSCFEMNKE